MAAAGQGTAYEDFTDPVRRRCLRHYKSWCAVNNLEPFADDTADPSPEDVLLWFLHDHYEEWSYGYLQMLASSIAAQRAWYGLGDPRALRFRRYLKRVKREKGTRVWRQTDAFSLEQVHQFTDQRAGLPEPVKAEDKRRVTRDVAYLLVGVVTGHRHAELAALRIGQLAQTRCGYEYVVHLHKGSRIQERRGSRSCPWFVEIGHLADEEECPSYCPACALSRQLEQRQSEGAGPGDLVFTDIHTSGPMTTMSGDVVVGRTWRALAHLSPLDASVTPSLGTRMLRVTAATLGIERGMSILEVCELLHHRSPDTTLLYVRRLDLASAEEFSLPF